MHKLLIKCSICNNIRQTLVSVKHNDCGRSGTHRVALQPNEIHSHWHRLITVLIQCLDVIHQVCEELIPSFQNAKSHDMVSAHVPNDISGQALSPAEKIKTEGWSILTLMLSLKLAEAMPIMTVKRFMGKFVKQMNGKANSNHMPLLLR